MERGREMTENSYKTPCGCIHYFVDIIDKQKITLVFLPGLTADHWSVKLVLLLYRHLHIIKIDGNTTHKRRCLIWLQNLQIYMQGSNQMSKKKQKVFCLHLVSLLLVLSEAEFNEELEKGYVDMQAGRTKNAKKAFTDIRKDYGL